MSEQMLKNNQRGIALIMALVFLMLLTLLGVTSMSTTALEEKMAANTKDRDLAFQAAETALLAGEAWIYSLANSSTTFPAHGSGLYDPTTDIEPWKTVNWNGSNVVTYPCTPGASPPCGTGLGSTVAEEPKYIVEKMGPVDASTPNTIAYRVTARGVGGNRAAVVMLQSTYVRVF